MCRDRKNLTVHLLLKITMSRQSERIVNHSLNAILNSEPQDAFQGKPSASNAATRPSSPSSIPPEQSKSRPIRAEDLLNPEHSDSPGPASMEPTVRRVTEPLDANASKTPRISTTVQSQDQEMLPATDQGVPLFTIQVAPKHDSEKRK